MNDDPLSSEACRLRREVRDEMRMERMKGAARTPGALPAAGSLLPDVPPLAPDPPAPNLDLFRATQEDLPL